MTDEYRRWGKSDYLDGITVLDFSRLLPGPFTTMHLADMGANVVRIEDPKLGDYAREFPPKARHTGHLYLTLNRNKRSLAVDFKTPAGRDLVLALGAKADIVIETYRPGVMESLGLGCEQFRSVNPSIVYCSLTGYGQGGPLANAAGHDLNYLAMTGLLDGCGRAGGPPAFPGIPVADLAGGMAAAEEILAAIVRRFRTGEGARIDSAMVDALYGWSAFTLSIHRGGHKAGRGEHFACGSIVGYNIYESAEGKHFALSALEPKFWNRFCEAVERPDWLDRGTTPVASDEGAAMHREVDALFRSRSTEQWIVFAREVDCCLTPILTLEETIHSSMAIERGGFPKVPDTIEGDQILPNSGFLKHAATHQITPAPQYGEHSREVLRELGIAEIDIATLIDGGVVIQADVER